MSENKTRCGFVAVLGAPNAGKSTLVNALVGQKVAIVSPKAQTTRTKLLGVAIQDAAQILLVDTPGIFEPQRRLDFRLHAPRPELAGREVTLHLGRPDDRQPPLLGPPERDGHLGHAGEDHHTHIVVIGGLGEFRHQPLIEIIIPRIAHGRTA